MLDEKIHAVKEDIKRLKHEIREKEKILSMYLSEKRKSDSSDFCKYSKELTTDEVTRYSRQMLVPDLGISGQIRLRNSKVLIVGAGGLGCPAAVYLAGAGIGEITIVDYDEVELTNLHRQILHTEDDIGISKVESVYDKLHRINRKIRIIPIKQHMDKNTLNQLISTTKFDVVVDGTDNVATRYLLNDACALNKIPLVSGSALQTEGQLTVYNYKDGPCYRCLFPVPPPPETVTSCGDGGVIGPVPGLIGVLQAFQTIKILLDSSGILSGRLLLFDGSSFIFRNIKLRSRNLKCDVCGENPTIKELIDYEQFCGAGAHDKVININILSENQQIDVRELTEKLGNQLVLDVRPQIIYEMCHLPNTTNFPLTDIEKVDGIDKIRSLIKTETVNNKVYVICRRGNDSQRAINFLRANLNDLPVNFLNVKGGLEAYSKYVDSDFPAF